MRTRAIITLMIRDAWLMTKQEINLMEQTNQDGDINYYFEIIYYRFLRPSHNARIVVSNYEVEKQLSYVKDLILPQLPERFQYLDPDEYTLTMLGKKYQWKAVLPKEWEPLGLIINWLEKLTDYKRFKKEIQRKRRIKELRIINLRKHHSYSLPKNYVLYIEKLQPAGMFNKIMEARFFIKWDNSWLELELEPNNAYDSNAIKIMGCSNYGSKTKRIHIGYIPGGYAAAIAIGKLFHELKPYLHRTYYDYSTNNVNIEFDIAGPVNKRKDFQEALVKAHIEDRTFEQNNNIEL